ncbi:hypothetical protein A5893_05395 [Pedobacter psychrophilus]|uniref:Uncharacterized protein n=1 Tax=Pedobacter psychrophilus TaxID=1826909 RepID=A0A179DH48_9SPHI|nr:hypothetical protein [Pedobacter psychrophilus]OAQ40385.1 hypothetical protein A5893_05395 [Pedobacter psychrophilus]
MSKHLTEADNFLIFHSNPIEVRKNQLSEINSLINKYPYCQSLHFLSAKAANETSEKSDYLANAAAFASSRETLFNFLENTASFVSSIVDELEVIEPQIEEKETINKDFGQAFGVDLNQMIVKEQPLEREEAENLEEETRFELISDEPNELEIAAENNLAFADDDNDIEVSNQEELAETIEEENETLQRVENVGIEDEDILSEENNQAFTEIDDQNNFSEPFIENEISEENHHDLNNDEINVLITEKIEHETTDENIGNLNQEENNQAFADIEQEQNTEPETIRETSAAANDNENELVEEGINKNNQALADVEPVEDIEVETAEESSDIANNYENDLVEDENEENEIVTNQNKYNSVSTDAEPVENIEFEIAEQPSENSNGYKDDLVEDEPKENEDVVNQEQNIEPETIEETAELENKYENDLVEEETKENEVVVDQDENNQALAEVEQSEDIEQQTEEEIAEIENEIEPITDETGVDENNQIKNKPERKSLEEILFDSPVQSDFFAFTKEKTQVKETIQENIKEEEATTVSQYNDDSLPYTFLWWLNKTRKEHSLNNNQPYVVAKPSLQKKENKPFSTDPLNHQIAENIFHLRSVEDVEKNKQSTNFTVPYDFRQKEHKIIEKFIKEEPQIKPPAANKIDTENKAKKSSEDANEVVSETLAKIYVEQMLYHKALDVYKKLSLKYPEKSTYFASQIKYLELKVN